MESATIRTVARSSPATAFPVTRGPDAPPTRRMGWSRTKTNSATIRTVARRVRATASPTNGRPGARRPQGGRNGQRRIQTRATDVLQLQRHCALRPDRQRRTDALRRSHGCRHGPHRICRSRIGMQELQLMPATYTLGQIIRNKIYENNLDVATFIFSAETLQVKECLSIFNIAVHSASEQQLEELTPKAATTPWKPDGSSFCGVQRCLCGVRRMHPVA